uniref:Copine C-terminal domain-containing protein n=1 Tax=Oryza brachyantha TaxID=4533 RepID=J3MU38_ORYBR
MGAFGSKQQNPSGQHPHYCSYSSSINNVTSRPRGNDRFASGFLHVFIVIQELSAFTHVCRDRLVTDALTHAVLESSNLIVRIDFTKSNEWTATTHDQNVFNFYPDNIPCDGFEQALNPYREIVTQLRLAGPTSFAPMIETTIRTVYRSCGQYHLSTQERETIDAIVKDSEYALSIMFVGVSDGPWDMMRQFDDNIPSRAFNNVQFVNFTDIMSRLVTASKKETKFALSALIEIPEQFKPAINLQLLGKRQGFPHRIVLPPPMSDLQQYYG